LAFSYIASVGAYATASATTLDTTASLNIAEKDLLVSICAWEDTNTTLASVDDSVDDSNSMEIKTVSSSGGNYMQVARKINAALKNPSTIRMTLNAAAGYRFFCVMQFRPDASETVTEDGGPNAGAGNSTAPASGAIDTTGDDAVICGAVKNYTNPNISNPLIAGLAADGSFYPYATPNFYMMWYKLFSSAQNDITASATLAASAVWICDIIAFKSVAAAGGSTIPRYKKYYDYRRAQ